MKTNKSYKKRVRVTKNGKLMVRRGGKNHFNAKESRKTQLKGKRSRVFTLPNKPKSRNLVKL